jgi:hypothetical protein
MAQSPLSRRALLSRALVLAPFCGVLPVAGRAFGAASVCESPDADDKSLRDSLHYVETSTDPGKTCAGCGLFAAAGAGCGHCMIFNGPANPKGHCDSWSSRG